MSCCATRAILLLGGVHRSIAAINKLPAKKPDLSETANGQGSFLMIGDFGDPFAVGSSDAMQHCWGPHWKCGTGSPGGHPNCGHNEGGDQCTPGSALYERDDNAQANVGKQMGDWAAKNKAQFVVNVGDNFYPGGISGPEDSLWQTTFEDRYPAESLQIPWLSINGNHDWGGFQCFWDNTKKRLERGYFQVDYDSEHNWQWPAEKATRWVMPDIYYSKRIFFGNTTMDFFFIDTNVVDQTDGAAGCGHGSVPIPPSCDGADYDGCKSWNHKTWEAQVEWMKNVIPKSDATWKFLIGHHPISQWEGSFGQSPSLASFIINNNISMYMCGHIHSMESKWIDETGKSAPTKSSSRSYYSLQNGAGGGAFPDGGDSWSPRWGFSTLKVNGTAPIILNYVDDSGKEVGPGTDSFMVPHPCAAYWPGTCDWTDGTWSSCVDGKQTRSVLCSTGTEADCSKTTKPSTTKTCSGPPPPTPPSPGPPGPPGPSPSPAGSQGWLIPVGASVAAVAVVAGGIVLLRHFGVFGGGARQPQLLDEGNARDLTRGT